MSPRNVAKVDSAARSKEFGTGRGCRADGCTTRLSRYNPDEYCSVHARLRSAQLRPPR